jgi:Zinc knuckle
MYMLLVHWKQDPRNVVRLISGVNDGVAFATVGTDGEGQGTGPRCFKCGKRGHVRRNCPERNRGGGDGGAGEDGTEQDITATQLLLQGVEDLTTIDSYQFSQTDGQLPASWILLDNQSTVNIFCNRALLKDIKATDRCMRVRCNAGWTVTNLMGTFPGYPGEVWFNPDGIANILSLADVAKHFRVRYDSGHEHAFIVEKPDGTERHFVKTDAGLFYLDTANKDKVKLGTTLLHTVADKKSKYTVRAYRQAILARKLQKMLGYPSTRDFLKYIDKHMIPNCPIQREDILAAEDILRPCVDSLKGKTVRRGEDHVLSDLSPIPPDILDRYRHVTLCADIMYVNKLPFLVTTSRDLRFGTAEFLLNRQEDNVGHSINMVHADGEFEVLRDQLARSGAGLNVCANDEHVPEVERFIRTVKERARCMYHSVPFRRFPALLLKEMIMACVFWLNMFPPHDGVSDTISPRALMTGFHLDYRRHCRLEFGAYVQTHEEHDNSMHARTTGAIAIRPTGNRQGGYYFMSLTTGRRLTRNRWTELPMPQDVIDRVNALGHRSNAPAALVFAWRDGTPVDALDDHGFADDDDDADSDYVPYSADDEAFDVDSFDGADDDVAHDTAAGVDHDDYESPDDDNNGSDDDDDNDSVETGIGESYQVEIASTTGVDVELAETTGVAGEMAETTGVGTANVGEMAGENTEVGTASAVVADGGADTPSADMDDDESGGAVTVEEQMDQQYGPRGERYHLQPRKPRDYSHLHGDLEHAHGAHTIQCQEGTQDLWSSRS